MAHFYQSLAIFLADRLRTYMVKVESGKPVLDESNYGQDELADHLLSKVSMAGTRFTEMQRREWGS